MNRWIVRGFSRDSGQSAIRKVIEAETRDEAAKLAGTEMLIESVDGPLPAAEPPMPTPLAYKTPTANPHSAKSVLVMPPLIDPYQESHAVASIFRILGALVFVGGIFFSMVQEDRFTRVAIIIGTAFYVLILFAVSALLGIVREIAINTRDKT